MRKLFAVLALLGACFMVRPADAPILRNSTTTNNPARLPPAMATSTFPLYPVMVLNPDGTGADRVMQYAPSFFMTGTNGFLSGILAAGGGKFTNTLTLNGSPVLTNAPGSGITNSGVGTNNYLAKWTGTNSLGVSLFSDDGTNITAGIVFSLNPSSSSTMVVGDITPNPDAALTIIGPLAVGNNTRGPYLDGVGTGTTDFLTLGLDDGAGVTKTIQQIRTARGLTDAVQLEIKTGVPTDGDGGKILIQASSGVGTDKDGGTIEIKPGNSTGTGSAGNLILRSGAGGQIQVNNRLYLNLATPSTLLMANADQELTNIVNAAGILFNDGTGGFGWTNDVGSASNPINNFYSTNNFFISGKGNTLVITQTLTVSGQYVYPLVPGTGITFATNNIGTGQTNLTISATASGGVTTSVTPLAYSGTNITGFNCLTNNATYTLLLTNHCLFNAASFTGLPNTTTNMFFTLALKQDGTGTWVPKFTNSIVAWTEGVQPVITTNANSISYLYFHSHLWTNGMLVGSPNLNVQ